MYNADRMVATLHSSQEGKKTENTYYFNAIELSSDENIC